jgi:hypothetical protein
MRLELSPEARRMMVQGLQQADGPWSPEDDLAMVMGFENTADLRRQARRISDAIETRAPLIHFDWTRALCCVETAALSHSLGVRSEWQTVTGIDEVDALMLLDQVHETIQRSVDALVVEDR